MVCLFNFYIIILFTSIHSIILCSFFFEIEVSKYSQQKHCIVALKEKPSTVWQKLIPTYNRDINKIYFEKYFRLIDLKYL